MYAQVTELVWPPGGEEPPTNLLVTRTSPALADGLALIGTQVGNQGWFVLTSGSRRQERQADSAS